MILKFLNLIDKLIDKGFIKIEKELQKRRCEKDFVMLKKNKDKIVESFVNGYKVEAKNLVNDLDNDIISAEVYIGEIDGDGYFCTEYELSNEIPTISHQYFNRRKRNRIFLTSKNGILAIKKNHDEKLGFVKEVKALNKLSDSNCNIPAILDLDFNKLTITISYIRGIILKEELARHGAKVRDRDIGRNPGNYFDKKKFINMKKEECKKYLYKVIDNNFIKKLELELNKLHSNGVINNDIKYQNIIIETKSKEPYILDFENSFVLDKTKGCKFRRLIKRDIYLFNKNFKYNGWCRYEYINHRRQIIKKLR